MYYCSISFYDSYEISGSRDATYFNLAEYFGPFGKMLTIWASHPFTISIAKNEIVTRHNITKDIPYHGTPIPLENMYVRNLVPNDSILYLFDSNSKIRISNRVNIGGESIITMISDLPPVRL